MSVDLSGESVNIAVRLGSSAIRASRPVILAAIRAALGVLRGSIRMSGKAIEAAAGVDTFSGRANVKTYHLDEKQEVHKEDIRAIRKELKRHNVNFSVLKDKKGYFVYFSGADMNRMQEGLETVMKKLGKDLEKGTLADRIAAAQKEAAARNAARQAQRQAERTVEREHGAR